MEPLNPPVSVMFGFYKIPVSFAECPVPYAVVFRGHEINEISTSPEDMEAATLMVLNAKYVSNIIIIIIIRQGVHSCPNLVASFPLSLAMTERLAFCFSDSPFSFSVSMLFYFLIVL